MKVKFAGWMLALVALLTVTVAPAQDNPVPAPPKPADEAKTEASPSDTAPTLNARTTRSYSGQAPMKQAPIHQAPAQAPEKQAPAPASAQAPTKGAMTQAQPHTVGYAPACANCQVRTTTTVAAAPRTTYSQTASRRGLFRRGYR